MASSLMVIATEAGCGKSVFSLGLHEQFERHGARAAYFKPVGIANGSNGPDSDIEFIHRTLGLRREPASMGAVTSAEVTKAIQENRYEDILDSILEAHAKLAEDADVIVCEGVDSVRAFPALDSDINVDIAKNIDAPVLLVGSGKGFTAEEIVSNTLLARSKLTERGADVFGVVINRVLEHRRTEVADEMRRRMREEKIRLFGVLPDLPVLSRPRIRDVVRTLEADVLHGHDQLDARVGRVLVTAMGLDNALYYLEEGCLLIAPGDREEILLAAAATFSSDIMPSPSGIILTGGFETRRKVMDLSVGLTRGRLPILRVEETTYETAIKVNSVEPVLEEDQEDKALAIRNAMEEYVDIAGIIHQQIEPGRRVTTPRRFLRQLRDKARADKRRIVLPEGDVDRILRAAEQLRRFNIVDIVLLGEESRIRSRAQRFGVTLDDQVEIINPHEDSQFGEYVRTLVDLRKHKNLPEDVARDLMADRNYFGTMMAYMGRVDGMVSGSTTTTQATLRPSFEFVRTKPGVNNASSVFFMCLPDKVLVYADCAVIPNPTMEQLADIAIASAETAEAFGIEPRVAMLSYSTGTSGKGEDVDHVRGATELVRERKPDLNVEGPIQYDAAVDPSVAQTKLPDSTVAGRATVLIFPDLNTGNNTYKAVQRSAGAVAVGPILQGLKKPVNDLSRGATITDIVNTVIVTAIQAQAS
jgi:phosphate acetyltransferase